MAWLQNKICGQKSYQLLRRYLPEEKPRMRDAQSLLAEHFDKASTAGLCFLDLGCGTGTSIDLVRNIATEVDWHGVDIESSPEVELRYRSDGKFATFDGVNLPYDDDFFDVVYSRQVLEHVRHPDALAAEIFRVLKPGGKLIGSVSQLEPFHSYSIFNFTSWGVVTVFTEAGFGDAKLYPGLDGFFLMLRQLFNRSRRIDFLGNFSLIYGVLDVIAWLGRLGHRESAYLKLQFSGHIAFSFSKAVNTSV